MYSRCMATTTISLTTEAYDTLVRLKQKRESISDVMVKHLRPKRRTCGELLDELERELEGVQFFDPQLIKKIKEGRGRRSNRPARRR